MSAVATSPSQPADSQQPARKRRSSGVVVPHSPLWYHQLGAWLIFALVRVVSATLRYRWSDRSGYLEGGSAGPAIYCVWHNRLALCLVLYFGYVKKHNRTPGMAALVSASKDGGFLAAILQRFGVQPVRGSTSRRGPQALLELTSWAERGHDLAITPDGPRGPRYVVKEGIIGLAQITGFPIIPASYYLTWKIQPKSWDRFQIPLPFSRSEMVLGKAIRVPRDASDEQREALRLELEQTLKEISPD
jgi:lysophospholipid acyltransferase (LPLAT)-like uncharacterized protein